MKGCLKVSNSAIAMELKVVVIAILVIALDFVSACFPNLSQNLLDAQLEKTEPNFYN